MHVLLADDDHDSAETLAELLLLAESLEVTVVFDGVELLAAATGSGTHPDVIVTDIEMPRMDGFTAANRIRSALGAATPLLIAVTGHMGLAKLAALHNVFDHVLLKPFKIQDLVKLLPDG